MYSMAQIKWSGPKVSTATFFLTSLILRFGKMVPRLAEGVERVMGFKCYSINKQI